MDYTCGCTGPMMIIILLVKDRKEKISIFFSIDIWAYFLTRTSTVESNGWDGVFNFTYSE